MAWHSRGSTVAACAAAAALLAAGCAGSESGDWATVREVTPAFLLERDARDPMLATDPHGRVALTFVTRDSRGAADLWLAISSDSGTRFGEPVRVNTRPGAVRSYAEGRPLAAFGPAGRLVVAWAERRAEGEGVDLVVRASPDGGVTLSAPAVVNDDVGDGKPVYHGFPALSFLPDGALLAAWLDERDAPPSEGEPAYSALFAASSHDGGQTWSDNRKVADLVCPCCRPMMVVDSSGSVAVAFRTAADDMRDPVLALSSDEGEVFAPLLVSEDRWHLQGCPDVGPALTAGGAAGGWYAWYTGADPAGVYMVPWYPGRGPSGVKRPLAEGMLDATHPRLAPAGTTTWIAVEGRPVSDSSRTVLAVRALDPDGRMTPWVDLGAGARSGWIAAPSATSLIGGWVEGERQHPRLRLARVERRR